MKRLLKAFYYSSCGLYSTFETEPAFRLEIFLSLFLFPMAFYIGENNIEIILLISSWLLVLICELFNSAIEAVVDRIGPERHALSKKAKDTGSAAVLLALVGFGIVWGMVLLR